MQFVFICSVNILKPTTLRIFQPFPKMKITMYHIIVKRIANKCLLYHKLHYCKVFALFVRCRLFVITTLATIMIGRCKFVCPFVSNLFHQLPATSYQPPATSHPYANNVCTAHTQTLFIFVTEQYGAWMAMAWHR